MDYELVDIAESFPANPHYLKDVVVISAYDAVLISLGIDVDAIKELREQALLESDSPEVGEVSGLEPVHLGVQQVEFEQRLHQLLRAIAANTLAHTRIGEQVRLQPHAFVEWAMERKWRMPKWLLEYREKEAKVATRVVDATSAIPTANASKATIRAAVEPSSSPKPWPNILRMDELVRYVQLSKSTIYAKISSGDFPPPIKLGERASGWRRCDVDVWLAKRGG